MVKFIGQVLLLSVALTACSGSMESEGTDDATSAGAPAALGADAQGSVVFSEKNADGVELRVLEFKDGTLASHLSGPISVKVPVSEGQTLEELYRIVRPEVAKAPANLLALSRRVELTRAAMPRVQEPSERVQVTIDKSQSSFNNTVCKTFVEGGGNSEVDFIPTTCVWQDTRRGGALINDAVIKYYDRTYGWNNTPWPSLLAWYNGFGGTDGYSVPLAPFTWNWLSAYGNNPDRYFYGFVWMNDGSLRRYNTAWDFGITRHFPFYVVK